MKNKSFLFSIFSFFLGCAPIKMADEPQSDTTPAAPEQPQLPERQNNQPQAPQPSLPSPQAPQIPQNFTQIPQIPQQRPTRPAIPQTSQPLPQVPQTQQPQPQNPQASVPAELKNLVMYGSSTCGYCIAAKKLLDERAIPYRNIEFQSLSNDERFSVLQRAASQRTFPYIFADEKLLGGYTELSALIQKVMPTPLPSAAQPTPAVPPPASGPRALISDRSELKNIVMYTSPTCGFCVSAKKLLDEKGISYRNIEFNSLSNDERVSVLQRAAPHRTYPIIFIDNKIFGGYTDLATLFQKLGL